VLLFYTAASETRSRNDENERFSTFESHTRVSVDTCLFTAFFKVKEDTASNSVETDGPCRMKQPNHISLKLISPPSSIDKSRLDGIIRGLYRWFGYSFIGACSNPKSIHNPPCLLQYTYSPPLPVRNWTAQQKRGSKFKETSISFG
jgi:hypothetical protein